MNKLFTISLLLLFIFPPFGGIKGGCQNLAPNPSFEDTVSCPDAYSQLEKAANWENWGWTPDYFNACALAGSEASVPTNASGYQVPLTGNAYAGLIPYSWPPGSNYREFIGGQLVSPLTIGTKYYFSLNVSTGYSATIILNCATSGMGLTFSTIPYDSASPPPINNTPHLGTAMIVSDTTNWTHISGSFTADSAYQYVIIGNFYDDSNTDTLILDNDNYCWASYYYIDDVCISTDSLTCIQAIGMYEQESQTGFQIYPNPASHYFNIENTTPNEPFEIVILNAIGQTVYYKENINTRTTRIDINAIKHQLLFIQIRANNKLFNYKLLKH